MPPPSQVPARPKVKVNLSGTPKTLLITLYSRWLDCQPDGPHLHQPLLNDKWAGYVLKQLDYNWHEMGVNGIAAAHMTLRARFLDTWTTEWLESHKDEPVTVLHLAVGLDARSQRLSWGRNVRWVDIDLPEVVELRKRLLPAPEGDYRLIAGSVLDDSVLEQVPNDRPTIVIFEGLVPFLEPGDVDDLIRRLCERYGKAAPGDNQLLFDGCGWIMLALQRWTAVFKGAEYLKKIGTEWKSSVDDPKGMEKLAPGLRLVTDVVSTENSGIKEMPGKFQRISWVMARLPGFRYTTRYLRYVF